MLVCCVTDFGEINPILRVASAELDGIETGWAIAFPVVEHIVKGLPACVAGVLAKSPFGDLSDHL